MAKYCPECGNKLKEDIKFCTECGYDLLKEQEADVEASKKTSEKKPEKEVKNKGIDISSNMFAGIVSIIILGVEILGIIVLFVTNSFNIGFMDIILIVFSIYVINKTLYKKQKLTKGGWIVFFVLLVIFMISFAIGFMSGFLYAID